MVRNPRSLTTITLRLTEKQRETLWWLLASTIEVTTDEHVRRTCVRARNQIEATGVFAARRLVESEGHRGG